MQKLQLPWERERRFCLVVETMADSFPEFDDIEIQQLKESLEIANMINGTKTYCNLVRTSWVKSKGYNADIFSYDARQLDEKMEKFFAEVSKRESREWLRLGVRHFACSEYRTCPSSRRGGQ